MIQVENQKARLLRDKKSVQSKLDKNLQNPLLLVPARLLYTRHRPLRDINEFTIGRGRPSPHAGFQKLFCLSDATAVPSRAIFHSSFLFSQQVRVPYFFCFQVADEIWQAVAKGKDEVVIADLKTNVAVLLRALAPRTLFGIMAKRALKAGAGGGAR